MEAVRERLEQRRVPGSRERRRAMGEHPTQVPRDPARLTHLGREDGERIEQCGSFPRVAHFKQDLRLLQTRLVRRP